MNNTKLIGSHCLSYAKALGTHILRLLGPKTILFRVFDVF